MEVKIISRNIKCNKGKSVNNQCISDVTVNYFLFVFVFFREGGEAMTTKASLTFTPKMDADQKF